MDSTTSSSTSSGETAVSELLPSGENFRYFLSSLFDDLLWRKQLSKVANLIGTLPFDEKVWP